MPLPIEPSPTKATQGSASAMAAAAAGREEGPSVEPLTMPFDPGRLGLVDHDTVDVTNLHRQVMHSTARVGMHKALSGRLTCFAINPTIQVDAHMDGFSPSTALALADAYDVVVDASDNPATRYLVSDACVVAGKPLVSAAAVGTDGQLTVYNYGEDGPCYRCLFPESPAAENCSRCGEAGVLGVVPGIMGCLQALEAIKILSRTGDVSSKKLTIFDALAGRFTAVRLRSRSPACVACGACPSITRSTLPSYDYVLFTGQPPDDGPPEDLHLIDPGARLSPADVAQLLLAEAAAAAAAEAEGEAEGAVPGASGPAACGRRTLFLDVRPQAQYDVVALPGVVHVPFERLEARLQEVLALCGGVAGEGEGPSCSAAAGRGAGADAEEGLAALDPGATARGAGEHVGAPAAAAAPRVVVLCRRGNNSQRVAARLAALGVAGVTDMRGGYQAWAREVDPEMPLL
ncbi:Adenylyltransferase and sulfurtransferase MOCS3 [Tetrabaena socialis]|uniref:Adenylyltransferase and sulfurtransferase MOCS3 n=1 Tax=Tetrabaena socialis TaxID=47790 RepID=A0A2J8AE85_9CHLO|nr:Adenylyltransferase and sulfurtransferase MOCS3 [Tetrabaena socialis]|eukprot:PNH10824.1 Adenylyltransferase and sulfurtransferase MOCS3 [Tetrabaena socialis]